VHDLRIRDVIVGLAGVLDPLVGEDVELTVSCAPDVGLVRTDPEEIERVVVNLVINARQAITGTGTIAVRVANTQVDETADQGMGPRAHVAISVSDTGIGMDEETRSRVFEPFFTTKKGGTGLGLATVRDIVTRSCGSIQVESKLGYGTTFTVYLPRVDGGESTERRERGQDS